MAKTRILQISHDYKPPFADLCRQYAELFDTEQYEVTTVFLRGEPADVLPPSCGRQIFLDLPAKALRGLKIGAYLKLKKIAKQQPYQAVFAHRFKSIYLAAWLVTAGHLPWVFAVAHEMDVFARKSRRWLAYLLQQKIFLVGVTDAVQQDLRQCCNRLAHSQFLTLHNCVDVERLQAQHKSKAQARDALGLAEEDFLFAVIARLIPKKNHSALLDAFAQASLPKEAKLVLLGDGRLQSTLQQQAEQLGISDNIIFLGNVKNAASYVKAFDCVVANSQLEAFGMVLIEAMAAQVPVVATAIPAFKEVMGNTGTLVPPGDSAVMAQVLAARFEQRFEVSKSDAVASAQRLQQEFSKPAFMRKFWQLKLPL